MITPQFDSLYSAWVGQPHSLDAFFLLPFVKIFGFNNFAAVAFDVFLISAVALLQPRLRLLLISPLLLWPGNWLAKSYLLLFALALRLRSKIIFGLIFLALAFFSARPAVPSQTFPADIVLAQINQFRGEHQSAGRFFHNKLELTWAFISHTLPAFNPSFVFGIGDRDPGSNSLWLPPLTPFILPLLILALIRRPSRFLLLLTFISVLTAALQNQFLTEPALIIYLACLTLLAHTSLITLSKRVQYLLIFLSLLWLLPSAWFSRHYFPSSRISPTGYGLDKVVSLAKKSPADTVLLADDLYPSPQSQISFLLHDRTTQNIRVVSALDPVLTRPDPNSLRLVAKPIKLSPALEPYARYQPVIYDPHHHPLIYSLTYELP